ncbi:MAG: FliH/SctL family protein [Firmicutes bacterium]|nr:FliH/SctL family protein [Bacillota bacterium]
MFKVLKPADQCLKSGAAAVQQQVEGAQVDPALLRQSVQDEASHTAEKILAQAQKDAEQLRRQARQEGYEQGWAMAQKDGAQRWRDIAQTLEAPVDLARQAAALSTRWTDAAVLRAAALLVGKLFPVLLEKQPEAVQTYLLEVAEKMPETAHNIFVSPEDVAPMQKFLETAPAVLQALNVSADAALEPGEWHLEGEQGSAWLGAVSSVQALLEEVCRVLE